MIDINFDSDTQFSHLSHSKFALTLTFISSKKSFTFSCKWIHPELRHTSTSHPQCFTFLFHLFHNRLIGMKCKHLRSLSVTDCREVTLSGSLLHLINSLGIRVIHQESVLQQHQHEANGKESGPCHANDAGCKSVPIIESSPSPEPTVWVRDWMRERERKKRRQNSFSETEQDEDWIEETGDEEENDN